MNVIIPIYRSTKQIKKQFGEMKENMQNMQQGNSNGQSQSPPANPTQSTSATPEKEGDYIDFEEVK